ncbi:MAG: hypothetical protein QOH13_177 [Thermoleophilaceae bacterium]|nr:hypothetical protein [Thermoleophilaceae bacterium]
MRFFRVSLVLAVVTGAFLAPAAVGEPGDAATGHLTRSADGNSLVLHVTNTGTTTLQYMRFDVKSGYAPSGPAGPAGAQCQNTGGVQFGCSGFALAPGQSLDFTFSTTPSPYPDDGGGTLHVSSGGTADATSTADGPPATSTTPPPPPAEQPCECASVSAFLNGFHLPSLASTRLSFTVNWSITCTSGTGNGCSGKVKVLAPKGSKFIKQDGKPVKKGTTIAAVDCAGPCTKSATGKSELTWLGGRTPRQRAGKKLKVRMQLICIDAKGVPKPGTIKTLTIAFKKLGFVDYKKSDMDGDGTADGKQLKAARH